MTREERKLALYCLKASSDYHSEVCEECINYPNCDHTIQDDVTETIIEALEQEPCEDTVSRQAAIDAMYELCNTGETLKENPWRDNPHIDVITDAINDLQPVNPQETSGDLISRQAVLDYIYNDLGLGDEENGKDVERQMELERSYKYVKSLSSVNPQSKTGHWIAQDIHNCHTDFKCSECGYIHSFMHLYGKPTADYTYCPRCGAKMESEDKE